jgi:anion-transporting  ArsA/GET3 family ATPase
VAEAAAAAAIGEERAPDIARLLYGYAAMWNPDERRFVFVTGKGGVGKTTVAAALGHALASRGKRVLIAMCNAKERISTMFASPHVGPEIVAVADRVWAVNIEPERAFEEYGHMILKVPGLYRVVFQNRYVRSFLPAVPGLSEWAMLGKAWYHTTERNARGERRFDVVLFDAPATGHGLDMLRVPRVILEVTPPGVLRRDAELAWEMFQDERATSVVVVTLPEELPVTETLELSRSIQQELRLPLSAIVVNGVVTPLFSAAEREKLRPLAGVSLAAPATPASVAVRAAAFRAERERLQAKSLERLSQASATRIVLPYLFDDAATPSAIGRLAVHF